MLERLSKGEVVADLGRFPVVALLGPRQVGKTTLALDIAETWKKPSNYLDLERDSDRSKLRDAEDYFSRRAGTLTIIDEIQRRPELFALLRSIVDARIRSGERAGQFLVLGSASRDLLQQSSESLAGRIAYHELAPFTTQEVVTARTEANIERLWLRGGFPASYLADDERGSWRWRGQFIDTYLERDIPQLGPKLPAEQLRRMWTMLAHGQGEPLNAAKLAAGLGMSGQSVRRYLDLLTDLYMVRQLEPWSGNSRKRLVRAPKVYVRDSGLTHRLAGIDELETLLGHPLCGRSWEGFAIEQVLTHLSDEWHANYFRTSAGAEIDLVLTGPRRRVIAIEIKRTSTPEPGKGFLLGCDEVGATQRYFAIPSGEEHSIGHDARAVPIAELAQRLLG